MLLLILLMCSVMIVSRELDTVEAYVTISPNSIDLNNGDFFLEAQVWPPIPYTVEDINVSTVMLENILSPDTWSYITEPTQRTPTAVYDKCGETIPYVASNAIDGNLFTFWRHSTTENHWIIVDMGRTMSISRIDVYSAGSGSKWGLNKGIEVYVSDNPDDWGSAVWIGITNPVGWTGLFSARGRYVKLYSRSISPYQKIQEIKVEEQAPIALMLRFNGNSVISLVTQIVYHMGNPPPVNVKLRIAGKLFDGTHFEGSDDVTVTS